MDTTNHNDRDVRRILRDTLNPQPESPPQGNNQPPLVRTSRLAVIACALAFVTLFLLPGTFAVSHRTAPSRLHEIYQIFTLAMLFCSLVFSLVSLVQIGLSKGRLAGAGFAWIGTSLSTLMVLFGLTLPLFARTRCVAFTNTCGTNLSGIGKAMLIYANDYEDELPRAGGRNTAWGPLADWRAPSRVAAYGLNAADNSGGKASISSCFYLLAKYAEVTPKSFICKGDIGSTEFRLADLPRGIVPSGFELIDGWDFGPPSESVKHYSFSYHHPFSQYALTVSSNPGFAVAADRNPWMDSPFAKARDFAGFKPDVPPFDGTQEQARRGNTLSHHGDGQSVLFLDTHVDFEKRPSCGLDDDNIYTVCSKPAGGDPLGTPPKLDSLPSNRQDSLLVHDPVWPSRSNLSSGR